MSPSATLMHHQMLSHEGKNNRPDANGRWREVSLMFSVLFRDFRPLEEGSLTPMTL